MGQRFQLNISTTATLGTERKWLLQRGGCCREVETRVNVWIFCPPERKKKQSLQPRGGRQRKFDCIRGTQREFSENICSEDDLRSTIFGTFVVNFLLAFLSQDFRTSKKWYNCQIFNGFLPYKGHLEFSRALFLAKIFEKASFGPYNFQITRLPARKSEGIKNFQGIKIFLYLPFKY